MRSLLFIMVIALVLTACGATEATPTTTAEEFPAATEEVSAAPTVPTVEVVAPETGGTAVATPEAAMETVTVPEGADGATEEVQVPKTYSSQPAMQIDVNKQYTATIETNKGTIVADLYPKDAPVTVNNFVFLAREGYYDGIIFHRIIPGFVIQGGDPTGTGSGGPGYQFEDELGSTQRPYETGSLAMANAGPNTNGSQFFIVLEGGGPNLGPLYNHFGKVTSGMEVVNEIASTPTGAGDRPQETVRIETITITEQ